MSIPSSAFIAGLPKAELHVHHVGSASPRIVSELAARHPGTVPSDLDELQRFYEFRDFAHFIEVYLAVVDLVRTPEDIRYLTYEVAREMAQGQQLRYAELTCTPYTSVRPHEDGKGMAIEAYTEAIEDARVAAERDFGLVLRWIYDIPGESGLPAADKTLEYALRPPSRGPDRLRARRSRDRRAAPAVPAALRRRPGGGAAQPCRTPARPPARETVWDALRLLGAERIGHGTSSAQDPALLAHLAEHGIPLEVCPSSNIATRAVATARGAPDAGVPGRGRDRHHQLRRPADVRHHAEPRVRDRRRPARPRRGGRGRAGPHRRAGVVRRGRRSRPGILGEIDDYAAG